MSIALWCVLVAAILPILTAGLAKASGEGYDNRDPRESMSRLQGVRRRLYAAHANGIEGFPFFAVAVLAAQMQSVPQHAVDGLAIVTILLRLGYTAAYAADAANLRSALWSLGLFAVIAIFTSPVWA